MIQISFAKPAPWALWTPKATFPLCILSILLAILVPCFISCGNSIISDAFMETILVKLPDPHPVYALLSPTERPSPDIQPSYTARWYDSDGQRQTMTDITEDFFITLETGVCTPILLVSETARFGIPDGSLPAAGAIYPEHGSVSALGTGMTPVLETSWLRGISASLAEAICVSSRGGFASGRNIAAHYNWQRFESNMTSLSDPSHIDCSRFVHAVLSGHFTKYDISCLKLIPVDPSTVPGLPAQTVLLPAWPESSGFLQNGTDPLLLPACEGINRYFCQKGYLTIQLTLEKVTCAFFTPYILQD